MARKLNPEWTNEAVIDLKRIYNYLTEWNSPKIAAKIIDEILNAPNDILFGEQYQIDEFFPNYRRIIIRNYKILYFFNTESIILIAVFNTRKNPSKLRR